ncbi:protein very KIND-like [Elysia marginata]|uniref:Protein very KIND-like n=1 Tax=Elysia marginata TaxID=1093978 RepID=A0AAV4IN53_9GAST|nr:protein very KIND-like [Elysia marginata]
MGVVVVFVFVDIYVVERGGGKREPEAVYVSPESAQHGEHSFKSHLFSLGMTLLFATEYNTGSDDPRAEISDTFTDLLTSLTQDDSQLRPDLDTVIEACEATLGAESSQDICLGIVGLQSQNGKTEEKSSGSSSIQQMSDELSAYLQSQSGLVDSKPVTADVVTESDKKEETKEVQKDVNDNSLEVKSKESQKNKPEKREKSKLKQIVRDASFDDEDSMLSDLEDMTARRQKGIMLKDLLSSIDRNLNETELWSLCREAVLTLKRKKKQLPAYISPDTLMVRESGTISFKAIPEEKPLEVIFMAPELQTKGVLNEKDALLSCNTNANSITTTSFTSIGRVKTRSKKNATSQGKVQHQTPQRDDVNRTAPQRNQHHLPKIDQDTQKPSFSKPQETLHYIFGDSTLKGIYSEAMSSSAGERVEIFTWARARMEHRLKKIQDFDPAASVTRVTIHAGFNDSQIDLRLSSYVLSKLTCVYGLGITMRSCAGGKYSSSLALADSEALQILLTSFLQLNQYKRPTLDTALEMCEQFQEVQGTRSRDVCQKMYREALEAATTKSEGSSQEPASKNSWDDSEIEQTTMASTDNTRSLAQAGDTTEAEDNIDDIPYDDDQDDTDPAAPTAFKTLNFTSEVKGTQEHPNSAFKPVAVKAKPARKLERVPSAFSSPATHFKPIVIQDKGDNDEAIHASVKEKDVVSKLREIKDNLQRHRDNENVAKEKKETFSNNNTGILPPSQNQQGKLKLSDHAHSNSSQDQATVQLQSQDNLPNTDALASAIAHYLKGHLSGGIPTGLSNLPQTSVHNNPPSTYNFPPYLGSQSQQQLAAQSVNAMGFSSFPNNASTIPSSATSITMSTYSSSSSSPMYSLNSHMPASYSPGTVPVQHVTSLQANNNSVAPVLAQYPSPFTGLNQMPVQFTLVQDPVTGLMQMVPCVMSMPPHSQRPPSQTVPETTAPYTPVNAETRKNLQSEDSKNQNVSMTVSKASGNSVQIFDDKSHFQINEPTSQVSHTQTNSVHTSSQPQVDSRSVDNKGKISLASSKTEDQSRKVPNRHLDPGVKSTPPGNAAGNENDSQSSSPSPSKDSGICVSQQAQAAAYSKDPLMERLLSSHDSHRQRTLSQVLRVIREEFADDGVFDSGVEDLAIAEYILSLTSLTWETFRCAITEKFFHLVWTYDLLAVLYETIGGSPSPQFRNVSKTPPTTHRQPFHQGIFDKSDNENISRPVARLSGSKVQDSQSHNQTPPYASRSLGLAAANRPVSSDGITTEPRIPHTLGYGLPGKSVDNHQFQQRPRSEVGGRRGLWSETSDSTDTESRDKRRRFRKRGELDKSKSSSLHNISVGSKAYEQQENNYSRNSVALEKSNMVTNTNEGPKVDSLMKDPFVNRTMQTRFYGSVESPVSAPSADNYYHGSQFQSIKPNYAPSSASHTPVLKASNYNSHNGRPMENRVSNLSQFSSKCESSHELSLSHQSQTSPRQTQGGFSPRVPDILPSKPSKPRSNQHPSSHLLPSRNYAGSSSSSSPNDQQTGRFQSLALSQDYYAASSNAHSKKVDSSVHSANDDDADLDRSAEMRRLAAQKPELFQDTRSSKAMFSQEKAASRHIHTNSGSSTQGGHKSPYGQSGSSQSQNVSNFPNASNRYSVPEHITGDRLGNAFLAPSKNNYFTNSMSAIPSYEPSTPASKNRNDHMSVNNRESNNGNNKGSSSINTYNNITSSPMYGRSLSAVYTRRHQPLETGVMVTEGTTDSSDGSLHHVKGHHRRGSDGSVHLPELNSALLPYSNKGQIVYHSAMIQLSLTSEVDDFIHSIDEENKRAIEVRLASVKQEITVQQRQRKKTQRFYRKLNEQSVEGKSSKGDQAISEQMLKDMTEMTRKISFLQLCQTHLQMLLAELYGLDSCFLFSLAATEPGQALVLHPVMENQYLQFRTVSTVEAGQMSVLQAGTPRGLMSYLYTSSALSDGYIHQFLMCFRYILTAEQLLSFILEKYRSAQSHHNDLNLVRVLRRSMDLLHVWLEGYYSIDFSSNKRLLRKLADFLTEQNEAKVEGAEELFSLYAACRMGEHTELMLATEMDEDEEEGATYFLHLTNPKRWESFRSLLRRSKSEKSSSGSSGKSRSDFQGKSLGGLQKPAFDLSDCPAHTLAEQLTLLEQETFRKCHPIHFLNSQCQGVGVALSIPGLRTPSMSRKMDPAQASKKGLFVSDPQIESYVVHMISHSQEVSHWVAAEVLSCGSNKSQTSMITKFLTAGHLCLEVKNFATGLAILDGLENLVVRQLPVWKNVASKYMAYLDEMTKAKMKLKGEALALMSEKDCHVFPTIPSALFLALHIQQAEIGGFTLANGMFKWDKMRCISEIVDQARIFRDHEYGFRPESDIQRALRRRLEDFSDQDLHTVASSQDNNFRRHSSSSSLSGTLKKVKEKLGSRKK